MNCCQYSGRIVDRKFHPKVGKPVKKYTVMCGTCGERIKFYPTKIEATKRWTELTGACIIK